MKRLTSRQSAILNFIRQFVHEHGEMPTRRELADQFGFSSLKGVADHLAALEKKGCLRLRPGRVRGIELIPAEPLASAATVRVPVAGEIAAGFPDQRTEDRRGTLIVDKQLLGAAAAHRLFAFRVTGESMTGRGIYPDDWVVADAETDPREGDIVVALIDGESTIKTLRRDGDRPCLSAENPDYPRMVPTGRLVIQGVVKAILRSTGQ